MKKQPSSRKYNFPDADMYMTCIEKVKCVQRDLDIFKQYGYTIDRLSGFAQRVEKFKNLPSDDELLGTQMIVTEKKYDKSEKLKSAIRSLMTRVAMKYNNRSGRYRKFGTSKMGDMSDPQLLLCGRRVVRVARQQIHFLADVGINENNITRVADASRDFETAIHIQQDKVHDRDISVESRIDAGNVLYDELITICNIGKDIWGENNPVRYEDYTIYESNNEQKKKRKAELKADEKD